MQTNLKTIPAPLFYSVTFTGILLILLSGCEKDKNIRNPFSDKAPIVFNKKLVYGTMTDQDGNTYKTIEIGTQTWMAENLRTTRYRNGDSIPNKITLHQWSTGWTDMCWSYDNDSSYSLIYGRLYSWFCIRDERNISPSGWHVPTMDEWKILVTFLGGKNIAGGKLKEEGTAHWQGPNNGATNESGFTALPAGAHGDPDRAFDDGGCIGYFWSSTLILEPMYQANGWGLQNDQKQFDSLAFQLDLGFSVRCIKD